MSQSSKIVWSSDISRAEWIRPLLHPFGQDAGSVIPDGFDAYCRIFHPVVEGHDERPRSWAEVAAKNGRIVHPEMQFHKIFKPAGSELFGRYVMDNGPSWGSCPTSVRNSLVAVLLDQTMTPERCWFCIWDGNGAIDYSAVSERVRFPNRYALYEGPIELIMEPLDDFFDNVSANLWWPEDHAWIVVTEIDYCWTYVGGTSSLIEKLIQTEDLEVMVARVTDKPFCGSDELNEALDTQ